MINIIIGEWAPVYMFGEKTKYIINRYTGIVVNTQTNKQLKHSIDKDGYHRVHLYHNGKGKTFIVSRLVYISFCGDDEFNDNITDVNHIDGDKNNNSLNNLEACSTLYNIRHAIANNLRDNRGVKSSLNIYPESTIHDILLLLEQGYSNSYIANTVGVSNTMISDIKRGRTWKHISTTYNDIPDYIHRKSNELVVSIIKDIISGDSNKIIAKRYSVDHKYVSLIRNNKRHKKLFNQILHEMK